MILTLILVSALALLLLSIIRDKDVQEFFKPKPAQINLKDKYKYFDVEHKVKENKFYPRFNKEYILQNYKKEYYTSLVINNALHGDTKEEAMEIIDNFINEVTTPKSVILKI